MRQKKETICILVAAHKKCSLPHQAMYHPIQVGAAGKEDFGYLRDDTGEHISEKNPVYCELTAMYWMWKNLDVPYCGLIHYRRYFQNSKTLRSLFSGKKDFVNLLDEKHVKQILQKQDVILPKKRNYYIETIYSHYAHTHYKEHLDVMGNILRERCPEYLDSYQKILRGTKAHMFNMLIMKKELYDAYCAWLFPLLEELEKRIDSSSYDAFQKRYPGRVSEILLNVWVEQNKLAYKELPVAMCGRVRWGKKIYSFLKAKFRGIRYQSSF